MRDHRSYLLSQMPNVELFLNSPLEADDVREFDADHVVIATGSRWRRDGLGYFNRRPLTIDAPGVFTPDDIDQLDSADGDWLIYDDEHYFTAGAIAEKLLANGKRVRYLTPESSISSWTLMTDEQAFIAEKLLKMGLEADYTQRLKSLRDGCLVAEHTVSGEQIEHDFDNLLLVTSREPVDDLFHQLDPTTTSRIGDCLISSTIADAVYSGHRFARGFEEDPAQLIPRRERAVVVSAPRFTGVSP